MTLCDFSVENVLGEWYQQGTWWWLFFTDTAAIVSVCERSRGRQRRERDNSSLLPLLSLKIELDIILNQWIKHFFYYSLEGKDSIFGWRAQWNYFSQSLFSMSQQIRSKIPIRQFKNLYLTKYWIVFDEYEMFWSCHFEGPLLILLMFCPHSFDPQGHFHRVIKDIPSC